MGHIVHLSTEQLRMGLLIIYLHVSIYTNYKATCTILLEQKLKYNHQKIHYSTNISFSLEK